MDFGIYSNILGFIPRAATGREDCQLVRRDWARLRRTCLANEWATKLATMVEFEPTKRWSFEPGRLLSTGCPLLITSECKVELQVYSTTAAPPFEGRALELLYEVHGRTSELVPQEASEIIPEHSELRSLTQWCFDPVGLITSANESCEISVIFQPRNSRAPGYRRVEYCAFNGLDVQSPPQTPVLLLDGIDLLNGYDLRRVYNRTGLDVFAWSKSKLEHARSNLGNWRGQFVACRDSLVAVPDEPAFNCTQTTYNAVIPIDFDESGMCFLCYWLLVNERSLTSCFFIGSYYVDLTWEHRTWPSTEEAYDSAPDSETLRQWEIDESEHGWY